MRIPQKRLLLQIATASFLLTVLIFLSFKYGSTITYITTNPSRIRQFLASYGNLSIIIFVLFQIILVIMAPIPSELVFIMGGYLYGIFFGTLYSFIGVGLGMAVVFWISATFGAGLVKAVIPTKQFERFQVLINCKNGERVIFLLFLIPEIPKDIITYIVGLTPLKPLRFFSIAVIARIPCILGSSYIGANIQGHPFGPALIFIILIGILLLLLFFFKDRWLQKIFNQVALEQSQEK